MRLSRFESGWGLKKYLNDYGKASNLSRTWGTIYFVSSLHCIKIVWSNNLVLVMGISTSVDTYSICSGNSTYIRNNGIYKREIM